MYVMAMAITPLANRARYRKPCGIKIEKGALTLLNRGSSRKGDVGEITKPTINKLRRKFRIPQRVLIILGLGNSMKSAPFTPMLKEAIPTEKIRNRDSTRKMKGTLPLSPVNTALRIPHMKVIV